MWLLDANMDVHLLWVLRDVGVACEAATRRGWAALDNGALVAAGAGAGFTCLLTQDRLFGESAAELGVELEEHIDFCVKAMQERAGELGL